MTAVPGAAQRDNSAKKTMIWSSTEREQASRIADEIRQYRIVSKAAETPRKVCLSASCLRDLIEGIPTGYDGRLYVEMLPFRQLIRLLEFDERHPFRWRIEHKLVQALLLDHFCPGSVPATCGLSRYVADRSHEMSADEIRADLAAKYVKPALGFGSIGQSPTEIQFVLQSVLPALSVRDPLELIDEKWVVQERLSIRSEFRVHTIEDSVIEDLTYTNRARRSLKHECDGPNRYMAGILRRLPEAFLANSVMGWDVAEIGPGRFVAIEANLSGWHPVFSPCFHCSGFFAQPIWGPYVLARLIRFVEQKYRIQVSVDRTVDEFGEIGWLYWWIGLWKELLDISSGTKRIALALDQLKTGSAPLGRSDLYKPAEEMLREIVGSLRRTTGLID